MAEPAKVPVTETKSAQAAPQPWQPFDSLRREIDRLFDQFDGGSWLAPFRRPALGLEPFWSHDTTLRAPAVDVTESEKGYEITAELPGLDEKSVEVKLSNSTLTIKGEKQEEKEEKKKDYYLKERRFGSFERSFHVPDGVDTDKIEASFNKGVLKVMLPKTPEAQKPEKKIAVKVA